MTKSLVMSSSTKAMNKTMQGKIKYVQDYIIFALLETRSCADHIVFCAVNYWLFFFLFFFFKLKIQLKVI